MSAHHSSAFKMLTAIAITTAAASFAATSSSAATLPPRANSAEPSPELVTPVSDIPGQDAVVAANGVLRRYPDLDAGFEWVSDTSTVYANLAGADIAAPGLRATVSRDMAEAVAALPTKVNFVVRDAALSRVALQSLMESITTTRDEWAGNDASRIVALQGDPVTGVVRIGVTSGADAVAREAVQHFGKDVTVITISAPHDFASRYNDISPWTAGNALWDAQFANRSVGQAICTQGFAWQSGGVAYASTAGHCGGTSWFHISTAQRIGLVAGTYYGSPYNSTDVELIQLKSGSVDSSVWVGGQNTTDKRTVVDADNVAYATGFNVCSSGANGGLACATTFNAYTTVTVNGVTVNNLTCATYYTSTRATFGDSGAPVLSTHTNGTVKAWGQTKGGDGICDLFFTKVYEISLATGRSIVVN